MNKKTFIEVKQSIELEQTDVSYKIKSKEIKKILRISKGEIVSINLWRGRNPKQELEGVSADNDIWEILVRIKNENKR